MKASTLYRTAAVLLVLFALGHLLGFRQVDPAWGVNAPIEALKTTHFDVQGMDRTYWDFFLGLGFLGSVFLFFSALFAFQLGGFSREVLGTLRIVRWAFACCFVLITALSWRYVGPIPLVLAGLVATCLLLAAWRADA